MDEFAAAEDVRVAATKVPLSFNSHKVIIIFLFGPHAQITRADTLADYAFQRSQQVDR